jgi:N6-L-threonylcarbamoyladenine synthase
VRGKPTGRGRHTGFERDASMLSEQDKANVAAAFQQAAIDVLIIKLHRTLEHLRQSDRAPQSLLIGGGVSANSLLRQRAMQFGQDHQLDVRLPKMSYCLDNAAMIAGLAYHRFIDRRFDELDLEAVATTESALG